MICMIRGVGTGGRQDEEWRGCSDVGRKGEFQDVLVCQAHVGMGYAGGNPEEATPGGRAQKVQRDVLCG